MVQVANSDAKISINTSLRVDYLRMIHLLRSDTIESIFPPNGFTPPVEITRMKLY